MKKYILDSTEFVNEKMVYCELDTFSWYSLGDFFDYCAEKFTGYNNVVSELEKKFGTYFESIYKIAYGDYFSKMKYYGFEDMFEQTKQGDKLILKLDDKHSFVFYPMCDCEHGLNKPRYNSEANTVSNPRYGVLVVYAVDGNNSVKFEKTYNHYPLGNSNFSARNLPKEAKELSDDMYVYVKKWGLDKVYAEKNEGLEKVFADAIAIHEEKENEKRLKREKEERQRNIHNQIVKNGAKMKVLYKENEVHSQKVDEGTVESVCNMRYLFTLNALLSIKDAVENEIHPDTSGMTNLENTGMRKGVYTKRNLPIDHYTLETCYRTHSGEICQHCGKDPIVNVMVIKNPKGEIFHVGNECVSHLVDIPEEEFEENWNAPFKLATNIISKVRNDKSKDIDGKWYVYGDKCYYVSSQKPLSDFELFKTNYLNDKGMYAARSSYIVREKVLKRDFSVREYDADFVKRMLPRYYASAFKVDVNLSDIAEMLHDGKHISFTNFVYDGTKYVLPTSDNQHWRYEYRRFFVKREDLSIGEYSQKFEDIGYELMNAEYKFGNVTVVYEWDTEGVDVD